MKKIINWGSFDLGKVIQKMTGRSSPSGVGTGLHDQDLGDGSSSPTTTWFWEFITIMTSKMVLDASSLSWKSPPSNLKCQKWCRFLKYSRASALITIKTYHKLVSFVKTEKVEMKYKNCTILQNSNKKWFIISSDKRHLLIFENYPKNKEEWKFRYLAHCEENRCSSKLKSWTQKSQFMRVKFHSLLLVMMSNAFYLLPTTLKGQKLLVSRCQSCLDNLELVIDLNFLLIHKNESVFLLG